LIIRKIKELKMILQQLVYFLPIIITMIALGGLFYYFNQRVSVLEKSIIRQNQVLADFISNVRSHIQSMNVSKETTELVTHSSQPQQHNIVVDSRIQVPIDEEEDSESDNNDESDEESDDNDESDEESDDNDESDDESDEEEKKEDTHIDIQPILIEKQISHELEYEPIEIIEQTPVVIASQQEPVPESQPQPEPVEIIEPEPNVQPEQHNEEIKVTETNTNETDIQSLLSILANNEEQDDVSVSTTSDFSSFNIQMVNGKYSQFKLQDLQKYKIAELKDLAVRVGIAQKDSVKQLKKHELLNAFMKYNEDHKLKEQLAQ
jgi:hypothetical protein